MSSPGSERTKGLPPDPQAYDAESDTTDSTAVVVERNDACQQDVTSRKHAVILDIDPLTRNPRDGMHFKKPTVEELLLRGPAEIMNQSRSHRAGIRWVHLRSNVMGWVEELMARVCEERRIHMPENQSERPGTPVKRNPLLRKDLWYHLFHGKASDQIQTRFMGPTCTPFSIDVDDEQSDSASNGSTKGPRDNLVMYLPYLNWESAGAWGDRQKLIADLAANRPCDTQPDTDFVRKYLHHETSPLHDRRTLEQAYYHDFGMTRSLPEQHQVMQRFTAELNEADAKLIVVDQLWLWVIKGVGSTDNDSDDTDIPDIVVTAFPGRFNGEYDSADIYHGIIEHLERGLEPSLRTVNDLVSVIVEHCTGVFFQRQLEADKWFLEFFAAAIGVVRDKQKSAFSRFCDASSRLEVLQARQSSLIDISKHLEGKDFSITAETSLFSQIKDIIDELGCIDYILARQEDVVKGLARTPAHKSRSLRNVGDMVTERRDAWKRIADTAQLAYSEIQAQMDLKQKQSSLAEARSNRYQVEDSARHGRIMLLFTVVTIIFLPMSFLATWFGMNIKDNKSNAQLRLAAIAAIIFPVSIVIAIVALAFASSERLRDRFAGILEKVVDVMMQCLHIPGSRSGARRRRSHVRDRGRPPRWDVRLRRLTEPDLEAGEAGREEEEEDLR